MHWVLATNPDSSKTHINLAVVVQMRRTDAGNGMITQLFFGGIAITIQGQVSYAHAQVLETPEQLFALAPVMIGPIPPETTEAQLAAVIGRPKVKARK